MSHHASRERSTPGEDVKAFGAGVLSSFGEMEWACSPSPSQEPHGAALGLLGMVSHGLDGRIPYLLLCQLAVRTLAGTLWQMQAYLVLRIGFWLSDGLTCVMCILSSYPHLETQCLPLRACVRSSKNGTDNERCEILV